MTEDKDCICKDFERHFNHYEWIDMLKEYSQYHLNELTYFEEQLKKTKNPKDKERYQFLCDMSREDYLDYSDMLFLADQNIEGIQFMFDENLRPYIDFRGKTFLMKKAQLRK